MIIIMFISNFVSIQLGIDLSSLIEIHMFGFIIERNPVELKHWWKYELAN